MGLEEKIKQAVKSFIQAKAQIAEGLNITINIGNNYYNTNFPENTDIDKIRKAEITPELEILIEEKVAQSLKAQRDKVSSLPEPERNQLIADSTAASAVDLLVQRPIIQ